MSSYIRPLEKGPRCKKWQLVTAKGSRGDRRVKTEVFYGGKRAAQEALKDFEKKHPLPSVRNSFEDFATKWNDRRLASKSIAQSTHDKYYWHIRAISPYLNKNLEDIRPSDIQGAYAALNASWTGSTLRSLHASLTRIFRAAQQEGLIGKNPMYGIDAPKNDTKEKRALTAREVSALLSKLDISDARQFAIALITRCGLRRGEVLGLEWRDVSDVIHIRREITKSNAGVRDVPLDDETVKLIEKRRSLVSTQLEAVGDKLRPGDKLCCGLDGRPLTIHALRKFWDRYRTQYHDCTLHELRHTFLTNLAQAGVHPSVMQRLAGHSTSRVTMDIYTHVHNQDAKNAISALNDLRCAADCAAREDDKKTGQTQISA